MTRRGLSLVGNTEPTANRSIFFVLQGAARPGRSNEAEIPWIPGRDAMPMPREADHQNRDIDGFLT